MIYTNRYKLPPRVIRVIKGKRKDTPPDITRMSVTDLGDDALPRYLYINNWDKITRDYSDFLTMVQGTSLHDRYERMALDDEDVEHKLEDSVGDYTLVGMADSYFDKTIMDVKQTSVYGPAYKLDKWTAQTNVYAWQRRKRGQEVERILIDVWYRNWKEGNKFWKDYPQIPFEVIELPLWSFEDQEKYVQNRIKYHADNPETPCSLKQKGIRYEVYKNTNKTPAKVGDSYSECLSWTTEMKDKAKKTDRFTVKESAPMFCTRYCKARSVCPHSPENN